MLANIRKHKKAAVVICLAAAVILFLLLYRVLQPGEEEFAGDTGIPAVYLEKQDLSASIHASGKVESANVVEVTTDVTSQVVQLNVSLGDRVQQGDVLCVLDDSQIRQQIADLEEQDAAARQEVEKQRQSAQREWEAAQQQLCMAESTQASARDMYQKVSEGTLEGDPEIVLSQLMEAQDAYASAQAQELAARQALSAVGENSGTSQNAGELKKLYQQLEKLTVVAEQSGIITSLNVSKGSIPSGTLMRIEDDSDLKVTVTVKEKDILKLSAGMGARVVSDAIGSDQTFSGTVIRVINFASPGSGVDAEGGTSEAGYSATVSLEPGTPLLLGMSVKVEIILSETGEQLAVPYDAVAFDDAGEPYVFRAVPQENGTYRIEQVGVNVGAQNDYYTAVTSDLLSEGDLIVQVPAEVQEGDEVELYIPQDDEIFTEE